MIEAKDLNAQSVQGSNVCNVEWVGKGASQAVRSRQVKVLCESFMLSVITLKTLVPAYHELYRLMLMLAMRML